MADIKWIKITTDIFDDDAIKIIEQMPEGDALIVIWLKLLITAGKLNDRGLVYFKENIPYTDETLAIVFNRPVNHIRLALSVFQKFGMIEILDSNAILIKNWEKHQSVDKLDLIKEQTRKRVKKFRENQKNEAKLLECNAESNVTSNVTVTQSNAVDKDIDKELDKDIDLFIENSEKKENFEEKKKPDPYINPINDFFSREYQKILNSKPYLMINQRNKLIELATEIENFKETVPIVLEKLKSIEFDLPNFTPNYIWLLSDDNYIKVLSGTYDKKKNDFETYADERGVDEYGN